MFETYTAVSEASTPLVAAKCSFVYLKVLYFVIL